MDLKKLEVLLRAADNGYVDLCFFSLIRSARLSISTSWTIR